MVSLNPQSRTPTNHADFPGTRKDFVLALCDMGARIEIPTDDAISDRPWHMLLNCLYTDWVRVFGEVEVIAKHFGPAGNAALETWQYRCHDGVVLCAAHRHKRTLATMWVTVRALYLC